MIHPDNCDPNSGHSQLVLIIAVIAKVLDRLYLNRCAGREM